MWKRVLVIIALVGAAGCMSAPAPALDSDGEPPSPHKGDAHRTHLGTFARGFVFFAFQPTGPDHEIQAEYPSSAYATYAYVGGIEAYQGETVRPRSVGSLSGPNTHAVSIRGDSIPGTEEIQVEDSESGWGAHMFRLKEGAYNRTWWIAYGAVTADGHPAVINLTIAGTHFRIIEGPVEADSRGFPPDAWSGTIRGSVGHRETGASITHERHLQFNTVNGTFLSVSLGPSYTHIDSVTLSNTTATISWTGLYDYGTSTAVGTPGGDTNLARLLVLAAQDDDWTLSVKESIRTGARPDHVLLADVALPPDFYVSD